MASAKAYIYRCMDKENEEKACTQYYSVIKGINPVVCANGQARKKFYQGK